MDNLSSKCHFAQSEWNFKWNVCIHIRFQCSCFDVQTIKIFVQKEDFQYLELKEFWLCLVSKKCISPRKKCRWGESEAGTSASLPCQRRRSGKQVSPAYFIQKCPTRLGLGTGSFQGECSLLQAQWSWTWASEEEWVSLKSQLCHSLAV